MVLSNKISFIKTNTASKTAPAQNCTQTSNRGTKHLPKRPYKQAIEKLAATKHSNQTSTQNCTQTSKHLTDTAPKETSVGPSVSLVGSKNPK